MADYQRKPIIKPKTPPPPPPKPKRTFVETEESLMYNPVYNSPITAPQGAQPKETGEFLVFKSNEIYDSTITGPQGSQPKELPRNRPQEGQLQTSPDQKKEDQRTSPPSKIYQNLTGPPLPPRNPKVFNTPPEKSLSKSPVAESTPKKGIFRNVYARARELFSRKKSATPYESLHQQASPAESKTSTPKKQGIFRRLFGGSTTPDRRQNDTMSDTTASPDRSYSGYSGDHDTSRLNDSFLSSASESRRGQLHRSPDFSPEVSVSYCPEAAGGRSGTTIITGLRTPDATSDVSASDLDEDDCYERVQRQHGGKLLSIQVNSPANIRVATSDNGQVTTCIETASNV